MHKSVMSKRIMENKRSCVSITRVELFHYGCEAFTMKSSQCFFPAHVVNVFCELTIVRW